MSPRDTRWLVWAALLASVAMLAALPALLPAAPAAADGQEPAWLARGFEAIALLLGAAALLVRRLAITAPIARGALDPTRAEDAARVTTLAIVSWALAEAIAVLGFVGFLLFGDAARAAGFAGRAAAPLLLLAPRLPARPRSLAEQGRDARLRIG